MSADAVAIEARKHPVAGSGPTAATASTPQRSPQRSRAAVVTLGARRQAALPTDGRPAPSVRDYDQLLTRRPGQTSVGQTSVEGSRG